MGIGKLLNSLKPVAALLTEVFVKWHWTPKTQEGLLISILGVRERFRQFSTLKLKRETALSNFVPNLNVDWLFITID